MYEHVTPELLEKQVAERLTTDLMTGEGSFWELHVKPLLMEVDEGYHELDALHPKLFPGPHDGQYIDDAAAVDSIYRKPGTQAVILIDVFGTSGAGIPAGSVFTDGAGMSYATGAEAVIGEDGVATVRAVCETAGAAGNINAGEVLRPMVSIPRVQRAAVKELVQRGVNAESDADLHARWLAHLRQPASSGNPYQVEQWALEIPGIAHAKCIPVPYGAGSVGVIVATGDYLPPDEATIEACLSHIYDEMPAAGLRISVVAVPIKRINIAAWVELEPTSNLDTVREAFAAKVTDYLRGLSFQRGAEIVYNMVTAKLMHVAGVNDFTVVTVDGGEENLPLDDYGTAELGELQVVAV